MRSDARSEVIPVIAGATMSHLHGFTEPEDIDRLSRLAHHRHTMSDMVGIKIISSICARSEPGRRGLSQR